MRRLVDSVPARERLVRAAISLFAKGGYHKTGTRDIARVADLSEVTLFRYFERKEDLFLTALRSSYDTASQRVNVFRRGTSGFSPKEALERVIQLLFDVVAYSPELLHLSSVALFEMRGEAREECFALLSPLITSVAANLNGNMEAGTLRRLNPSLVATGMILTAVAHEQIRNRLESWRPSQPEEREKIDEYATFWTNVLVPVAAEQLMHAGLAQNGVSAG